MGTKERHDRERQAVTASILTAARDLFVAEGYQSVSIRKIAERIEYSPAAIYSYFASKDDIFLALAEEGFHRLDERVRSAGADATTAVELVRARWWAVYQFSQDQPAYFELMFVDRSVPRITQQWDGFELLQRMLSEAVSTVQRAIDEGGFAARHRFCLVPRDHQSERGDAHAVGLVDRPGRHRHSPSSGQR